MATLTTIATFTSDNGTGPNDLIMDAGGDLIGTTDAGGANSDGVVFELVKSGSGYGAPVTLATFTNTNGAQPGGLIADAQGNLYGTTVGGGADGHGTVFEMVKSGSGYSAPVTIGTFTGSNGFVPNFGLVMDAAGNLFGTTQMGPGGMAVQDGTVFELTKSASGYSQPATIASFTGSNGANPYTGLIMDAAGNLFATTESGGANGDGTVFEMVKSVSGYGAPVTLANFNGSNGANPYGGVPNSDGGLIMDAAGNLYGTTADGGANNDGTVFELVKSVSGYGGPVTLASFSGSNGANPEGSLLMDAAGDLFGTTDAGGANNDGTAFKLVKSGSSYGALVTLVSFNSSNGASPHAGLLADAAGNLFGTTNSGGANGDGTVFEITGAGFQTGTVTPSAMAVWQAPEILTPPVAGEENFTPSAALVGNNMAILVAYSPNYKGSNALQLQIYQEYEVNFSGNSTQLPLSDWDSINHAAPEAIPVSTLAYGVFPFNGSATSSLMTGWFDRSNGDGTYTYGVAVVDPTTSPPTIYLTSEGLPDITVTPVSNIAGGTGVSVANLGAGNTYNDVLFEVAGVAAAGSVAGTFDIVNSSDNPVVKGTGFSFSDGKAHAFAVGGWDSSNYSQLVEVWNAGTGNADLQLSLINASTGAVTTGWTAATELQSITNIGWQNMPAGGMLALVDGSDASGRGFFEYLLDNSSSSGGTGGTMGKSLATHYSGTVTQDAKLISLGSTANEYVVYWVDGTGLNLNLVDSNLQVLETYNLAAANGTANVQGYGDGRLFVSYVVDGNGSSVDNFAILDTRLQGQTVTLGSGAQEYAGTIYNDTITVGSGNDTIYGGGGSDTVIFSGDRSSYTVSHAATSATVTDIATGAADTLTGVQTLQFADVMCPWNYQPPKDFNGDGTSDILFTNTSGTLVDWTLKNGTYSGWNGIGTASGWTVAGTGDFNGDGTSDVLFTNASGTLVDWTLKNGTYSGWNGIGSASGWTVAGTGDFNGDGTNDVLFQNGSGEVVDWTMKNGTFAGWNDIGNAAGWKVAGTGDFNGDGTTDILFQNGSGEVVDWTLKNGTFAGWNDIGNAAGWTVAGTGDFNGDGTSDILFQNGSGEVVDWMLKNGAFSGWNDIGNASGWTVAGTGDYGGNGTSGILFQNGSGEVVDWMLKNGAFSGWHDIGNAAGWKAG